MNFQALILVDNSASGEDLRAEHGLAVLIRGGQKDLLFDCGASGECLAHNARALGVELAGLGGVVISHGHHDHTGGLATAVEARAGLPIWAHPSAFLKRWSDRPGQSLKDISCPHSLEMLQRMGASLRPVRAPEMPGNDIVLSGPVGGPAWRQGDFVIRRGEEMVADSFEDEIFCLLRGQDGWAIVTGCCHRGMANILRAAKFLTRGDRLTAIVGGLHLRDADERQLQEAAALLEAAGRPRLYPCHCTGQAAIEYLARKLPGSVTPTQAGMRIDL